jgi:hypothetical protein
MTRNTICCGHWSQVHTPDKQFQDDELIGNQIEIIHQFVSLLLEKSENLDPDYTAAVDKHFWDLA